MAAVDLCLISDYRAQAEQTSTTTTPDALVQALITAASRIINHRYEREFVSESTPATRRFRVDSKLVMLQPYDLRTVTTMTLNPEQAGASLVLVANTDYALHPVTSFLGCYQRVRLSDSLNLSTSTLAVNMGHAYLDINGAWGIYANTAAVPDDVRRACVLTVTSWLDRAVSEYGDLQGVEATLGGLRPDAFSGWPIPLAAHMIFQPYRSVVV